MMSYHAMRSGKASALTHSLALKNIKKELGDADAEVVNGDGQQGPEVVVHDNLDAQSQILCGISKV